MTALLKDVERRIGEDCLVKGGLKKDGCKVAMTGAPAPRLVVDFDKPGSPLAADVTRCDYLVIAEGEGAHGWVAVLELKRGKLHEEQVVRQLQAGASAAENLVPRDAALRFRPIVASGSRHRHEYTRIKNKSIRIRFHGHREPVRIISCGERLAKGLGR